jgi:hypothetical protein
VQVLPGCIAALSGLTHLDLGINRLEDLPGERRLPLLGVEPCCTLLLPGCLGPASPGCSARGSRQPCSWALPPAAGPYLAELRQLVLRSNALVALPRALAGAPHLELIDAGENEE